MEGVVEGKAVSTEGLDEWKSHVGGRIYSTGSLVGLVERFEGKIEWTGEKEGRVDGGIE